MEGAQWCHAWRRKPLRRGRQAPLELKISGVLTSAPPDRKHYATGILTVFQRRKTKSYQLARDALEWDVSTLYTSWRGFVRLIGTIGRRCD